MSFSGSDRQPQLLQLHLGELRISVRLQRSAAPAAQPFPLLRATQPGTAVATRLMQHMDACNLYFKKKKKNLMYVPGLPVVITFSYRLFSVFLQH